jgi:PAS domain S-box-containing protein
MTERPAYEEMERKIKELEKEVAGLKGGNEVLTDGREMYRLLVETMNDGLAIQDGTGLLTFVNDKVCEMLGYSKEELIGRSALEFLDSTNRSILKEQISARSGGKQVPYEISLRNKNGLNIQVLVSPQSLFDGEARFRGSFGIISDISELKQTQEALRKAQDDLERQVERRTAKLLRKPTKG